MSAFLGPIHYWLYGKVQLQEALIETILTSAAQRGWDTALSEKTDSVCGEADLRPLEEIIDQSNIHGWLQQKIGVSEKRLAFAVTSLLKQDENRLAELLDTAYGFGQSHALQSGGADSAFQVLGDRLLDGMPCDHVNRVLEKSPDSVVWEQTQCVHSSYWEQVGGDISVYYALRTKIIEGMLSESGLTFCSTEDGLFEIRKGRS